jgi:aryl-alcohol dehydrogenase-like predicted oxidoreductase
MRYAALGRGGMQVSRVCLGTMTFGTPVTEPQACDLVHHALERGVNFFDAANMYEGYSRTLGSPGGVGEEILGKALSGHRQEVVICTKFANPVGLGPLDAGLSARHLEFELEKSLRRLNTDWIDLVLAHRWDPSVAVEEVWRIFDRWVHSGKVLQVGVSNWPTWRVAQVSEITDRYGWAPVTANSTMYNLLHREAELEQFPCARHYNIALLPYQPFSGGVLTGKYRRGEPAGSGSRAAEKANWLPPLENTLFDKIESLEALAREASMPMAEYVVSWVLSRPMVASIVVGCRNKQQLDMLIAATDRCIPADHVSRINSIFPSPKPWGGEQVLQWREKTWKLEDSEV